MGLLIVLAALAAALWWGVSTYNDMVSRRNRIGGAFSQIDVQLKRRYDLIPNLVETCKGYMKHESGTLEAVVKARNSALSASDKAAADPSDASAIQGLAAAEGSLGGALGKLFALQESYPDLKANENMRQLMEELSSTENKVAFARQYFNDEVQGFNISIEKFPGSLIAGLGGFSKAAFLKSTESDEERKSVKVSF